MCLMMACRRSIPFSTPIFLAPSYGVYNILWQAAQCRAMERPYLYLGYWVGESRKMAYKTKFRPIEGLIDGKWTPLPGNN
jgi:leucyl-tRNA---protein transferase